MEASQGPISVPSIPDVISDALRKDIARGALEPGRITIRELATRFGVSAMPVREALRRLEAEGLVKFHTNRAIVINELSVEDLEELFAIRIRLEELAMARAIPHLRDDAATLAELDSLVDDMDEAHGEAWLTLNEEFHRVIYAASDMPRLKLLVDHLWVAAEPYLRLYVDAAYSFRIAQEQHREMLRHVRSGEVGKAQAVLREHLERTLQVRRDALEREAAAAGDA